MSLFKKAEMSTAFTAAARKSHRGRAPRPLIERFEEYVWPEPNSGCWLWSGPLMAAGYSQIFVGSKADGSDKIVYGHRLSWEMFKGPIPDGFEVDHKCQVRCCVNPDHFQLLVPEQHSKLTMARVPVHWNKTRSQARTHCRRGHQLTSENTRILKNGERDCIACRRQYLRDWRAARRSESHVSV